VGILLWAVEAVGALVISLPSTVTVAVMTGHLPQGVAPGTGGAAMLAMEAAWVDPDPVLAAALVGLGIAVIQVLLVAPLLTSMALGCLAGDAGSRPGPWSALREGIRKMPRFILLNAAHLVLLAGACAASVWLLGALAGAVACVVALVLGTGLRDVLSAPVRRTIHPVRLGKALVAMLRERPLHMVCGFVVQSILCWTLLVLGSRLQLVDAPGWVAAVMVTAGAQALVLGRCLVRAHWLDLLVTVDAESAGS
jgi:hypothetical protein